MAFAERQRRLLLCALVVLAGDATAQVFVCNDARGRRISADQPPAECAGRTIRELRPDGSVRRVIEPPPTVEEKAAQAAEEKRRRDETERQRETMRRDLALLDAYSSEEEIEEVRKRALATRQLMIDRALKRAEEHKRERKKLDNEAEFYANRPLPQALKQQFESNAALIRSEDKIIKDVRADMDRINERYDTERRRWRELINAGATPRKSDQAPKEAIPKETASKESAPKELPKEPPKETAQKNTTPK